MKFFIKKRKKEGLRLFFIKGYNKFFKKILYCFQNVTSI